MAQHVPVAILGAGLTGLSAALALERRGADYRLFERLERVGGHARTDEEAGYRFDRTGHLLHLRSPALREEVLELLGGDALALERRSVVFSHGTYTRYPFQANTFGLPPRVAYECVLGFFEATRARGGHEPENFRDYCLAHFGAGISRHFMLPYNEKLWGVPLEEISASWCRRFVPLPTLEDVVAGAVGLADRELGYNARFLYPRRGIGALPEAMARRVSRLELGRAPKRIRPEARELVFDDAIVSYGALVSSAPLDGLLDLCDALPPEVARARGMLRCTHLYYLDVALRAPVRRDFHWAYVPEPRFPFYRVGCYSNFSPEMAPAGKANLYVELAAREAPVLERLVPEVTAGLVEMGLVGSAADVAFARLRRIDHAYVIHDRHHEPALAAIRPFLDSSAILSTGRYGGWNYSSMEDALEFGKAAAEQACRELA